MQRILKMREFGLIEAWLTWIKADASRCLGSSKEKQVAYKPLSIKDVTGLGLILFFGFGLACFVFICEHLFALFTSIKVISH